MRESRGSCNMRLSLRVVYLIVLQISVLRCQHRSDMLKVYSDVVDNNDPRIRPVLQQMNTTTVYLTYFLTSINGYAESSQTLSTSGYLQLIWYDEFLTWNASLYGGANFLKPDAKNLWKPAISILNAVDYKEIFSPPYSLNLFSNGMVVWYPGDDLKTYCEMDVTLFPFDTQTCSVEFFISSDPIYAVDMYPRINFISMDAYQKSNEWNVVNTSSVREVRKFSDIEFAFVVVSLTLDRKPSNLILSVLLPVLILAFLNIFVFMVTAESGEKIAFAMTSLLTYAVLLSFVTQTLPKTADTTSILAAFVGVMTGMNAVFVFLTIFSLRLFHRDTRVRPVPMWGIRFVLCFGSLTNIEKKYDADTGKVHPEKQTTPIHVVTWKHVSRTLDKLWFGVFMSGLLITIFALFIMYECR